MGNKINSRTEHYWYKAFLLGLFFSAAFFIPYIVIDHGYFLYYGDFNVQQIPFYQMIHDAIRNETGFWSTTTDLGSSVVGSYTFYMLGSPFFWITLPFPSDMVPHLMGPLLILKFGTASLTGYIYLRRYVRDKNLAVIGGLLYAFSGFSVYNVFFNHFHEAIITFPLLLAAFDEYMDNHRRGVVALAVFTCCFVNYYFFVGMVAFVIIYWFLRMLMGSYKLAGKDLFPLAFEVGIGFAMTAVILVPTVLFVTQNPRVEDAPQGFAALVYGWEQRYLHIISSFFFPPDIPARPNFTPDSNAKWGSVAAWLPMFGMTGVVAFLQSRSKSWLKKLLPFLFICTLVPILNAIFQMFVMSYYARWFYMLTLMMSLATIMAIENSKTKWQPAIRLTLVITMFIAIGIGFMPTGNEGEELSFLDTFGLEEYSDRFWVYVAITMMSIAAVILLIRARVKNKKTFFVKATACLGVISVLYSGYIIGLGKTHGYETENFIIPYCLNKGEDIGIDRHELANCRSDFYESMDNMGMFWQIPNIQAFQSIVPGSIYQFYPSLGVSRDVGSRPEADFYGVRSLLSVKYLFDYAGDSDKFRNDSGKTRMPGYKYIDTRNGFEIFENKNYISYGFWYDSYITEDQYYEVEENQRHLVLLKALVLNDEQAKEYGGSMKHIIDVRRLKYDVPAYTEDCQTLRSHTCNIFTYGKDSFHAQILTPTGEGDKLVFFSVPYEKGWTATVNGEPAQIEQVNIGFMAVRVPEGQTSTIDFSYKTPGLFEGCVISGVSLLLFVAYLLICAKTNKLKPRLKLKKSYKVAAIGSQEELGERYKNLHLARHPMKKKRVIKSDSENNMDNTSDVTPDTQQSEDTDAAEEKQSSENTAQTDSAANELKNDDKPEAQSENTEDSAEKDENTP